MAGIYIKNWNEFQHFKDRSPPWIKLYKYILDDPDWHSLSGDDAKHLVMLWLIASEDKSMNGVLPEIKKIAFRLRISENDTNQLLNRLSNWLIFVDIEMISTRYQSDAPEKRREETEKETESISPSNEGRSPNVPIQEILNAYHEILPELPAVKVMTDKRAKALRQRWREDTKRQDVSWWRKYFNYVKQSGFLTGREINNGRQWTADFEWLINSSNLVKVIEGKYHAE